MRITDGGFMMRVADKGGGGVAGYRLQDTDAGCL